MKITDFICPKCGRYYHGYDPLGIELCDCSKREDKSAILWGIIAVAILVTIAILIGLVLS